MKLGRIARPSLEGLQPRLIVAQAEHNCVIDLATAEYTRLLGVTIFNDFSARDIQLNEMKGLLGPAKGKDFATGLGPWITTPATE